MDEELDKHKYGLPKLKKYPMPDAKHVRSAIKFFNYVTPSHEKELAAAILKRMKEYGMSFDDFNVGEDNRFSKYIPETSLEHHGILGQKWGIRRFQNSDGSLTPEGRTRYKRSELRADSKQLKSSYKKARYAAASTWNYKHKDLNQKAKQSAKYEAELNKQVNKEYRAFVKKYGKEKAAKIKIPATVTGKAEVDRILHSTVYASTVINTIIPFGPLGWAIGTAYGVKADNRRMDAYEKEIERFE